jgi:hypothetical protein
VRHLVLAGRAAATARAGMDPPVHAGHISPAGGQAGQVEMIEEPGGVGLQALQLQDGVIRDVAG